MALIPGGADSIERSAQGCRMEYGVRPPGDLQHRAPPTFGKRRRQSFTHERVIHHRDQIVLGLHVIIQAHRSNIEVIRQPAHRYRLEAFPIGNGQRRGCYSFATQARFFL